MWLGWPRPLFGFGSGHVDHGCAVRGPPCGDRGDLRPGVPYVDPKVCSAEQAGEGVAVSDASVVRQGPGGEKNMDRARSLQCVAPARSRVADPGRNGR